MKKFEELIDVSLDEAARLLQKAINYGDYLAEQKKHADFEVVNNKAILREKKLIARNDKTICSGSDADARKEQAEHYAARELKELERSQIEVNYISDMFKNNHDRVEALRSVMSSKRQNLSDYQRNSVN